MRIYLASSWRNTTQPMVVEALRRAGFEVYDFRNPKEGEHGFAWSSIDPNWQGWSTREFEKGLQHPLAKRGYELDKAAMDWASAVVLLQPHGVSAALEAGFIAGSGRKAFVLLAPGSEPELMLKLLGPDAICHSLQQLIRKLGDFENDKG